MHQNFHKCQENLHYCDWLLTILENCFWQIMHWFWKKKKNPWLYFLNGVLGRWRGGDFCGQKLSLCLRRFRGFLFCFEKVSKNRNSLVLIICVIACHKALSRNMREKRFWSNWRSKWLKILYLDLSILYNVPKNS